MTTVIIANLIMTLPAMATPGAGFVVASGLKPSAGGEEGRAEWRGLFRGRLAARDVQRNAASSATATNSSAR
jgi:hypothetical protein